jgi:hypothetical protein
MSVEMLFLMPWLMERVRKGRKRECRGLLLLLLMLLILMTLDLDVDYRQG